MAKKKPLMNDFWCKSCLRRRDKKLFRKRINGDGLRDRCIECEDANWSDKKWCPHHNGYFPLTHFKRKNRGEGRISHSECREVANARERKKYRQKRNLAKAIKSGQVQQILCCKW